MDTFEGCTTDLEVHNKLWQLLCCDYLHEALCRDSFQRFKIASRQKLQSPQAHSLEKVDDILNALSKIGELSAGKYECLKTLAHDADIRIIPLIEKAEKKIENIKGGALLMESTVYAVEPDSLLDETRKKVDLILLSVIEGVMCKIDQGISDSVCLLTRYTELEEISDNFIKLWHGKRCRCRRTFGQKLVLKFVSSGANHLEKGEDAFENFKANIAPKLRDILQNYTEKCVHSYLDCGKPVANVSSSVLTYWEFSSIDKLDRFWRMYDNGEFDTALHECFNAPDVLMLLNVRNIYVGSFVRKESLEKCRNKLKDTSDKEIPARKEEPAMTASETEHSVAKDVSAGMEESVITASGGELQVSPGEIKEELQRLRFSKTDDPKQGYTLENKAKDVSARKEESVMTASGGEVSPGEIKETLQRLRFPKTDDPNQAKDVSARKEESVMTASQGVRFPKKDDSEQSYTLGSKAKEISTRKEESVMGATKAEYSLDDIPELQQFPFPFASKEKGVYPEKGVSELEKSSEQLVLLVIGGEQKIYSSLHEKKDPTAEYFYLKKPTKKSETFDDVKKETEISSSIQKKSPKHQEHPKQSDPSRHVKSPKAAHLYDIDVEIRDDMSLVHVRGMMVLSGMVVIVDRWNRRLKLFSTDGKYLSSITVDSFIHGITRVSATEFALIEVFQNCISFWRIDGERITNTGKTFRFGKEYTKVCFNETYFCLISKWESSVLILDKVGKEVKMFQIKEAFKGRIAYVNDVHMDEETNNIYITCYEGVLCVSVEGDPLWSVDVIISSQGITEINGELCVVSFYGDCLHMITKEGEYKGILLEMDDKPEHLYYDEDEHLLIVSFWASNKLSIYQIKV